MATGDANDMAGRIYATLPKLWFAPLAEAPLLNALLVGIGTAFAYCYSLLAFVRLQTRLSTSSGVFVDLAADGWFGAGAFPRKSGETDAAYIIRIKANRLITRGTRPSFASAMTTATGVVPVILEPMNPGDTGGWGTAATPAVGGGGGYDQGGVFWGSLELPGQFFVQQAPGSLSTSEVYADIAFEIPAGVIAWTDVT